MNVIVKALALYHYEIFITRAGQASMTSIVRFADWLHKSN